MPTVSQAHGISPRMEATARRADMHSSTRIAAYWTVLAMGASSALSVVAPAAELPPAVNRLVDFAADVQPILHTRCFACHGPSVQMNGLRFDRRDVALRGGHSGPAILPNDSAGSALVLRVASPEDGFRMPPVDPRLTREEVGILRAWIDQGASWPEDSGDDRAASSAPASGHWAFQPISRQEPPQVSGSEWVQSPIDRFVLAKLESEGIAPSPAADKLTLLRRLSLDLIGLPPTWEQAEEFLADSGPAAYERLVDTLLDSKHYGEKWARHWLDLARYADSDGYEKDLARPYAWRWREWVIEALNRDMPFDEFTKLQLAADFLENPTPGQLAATGFHRNTLRNREGGTIFDQSRFEETLDRVNTVATTWLGLTVECAQCHDHKYDPISQEDFYSFYAYFDNVEDAQIAAPLPGEMGPYLSERAEYLRKRRELLDEHHVPELQPEWERQMKIAGANPGERTDWDLCFDVLFQMTDNGWDVLNKDPAERTFREREVLTDYFIDWYNTVVPKERIEELGFKELRKKLKGLKESYPQLSEARIIRERDKPGKTFLRVRGQWDRKGIEVAPRPPAFLPGSSEEGRATRLDLAEWILSEGNPLTAPCRRQPDVAGVLRPGARSDIRGLRNPGRAALAPGAARLVGRGISVERLEHEADAQVDRHVRRLQAVLARPTRHCRTGSGQCLAGSPEPNPAVRRDPAGFGAAGQRPLVPEDWRSKRISAAAGWCCGPDLRLGHGPLEGQRGPGTLPERPVHLLSANRPLSAADELRRSGLESHGKQATALEHALAGLEPLERRGLCGVSARTCDTGACRGHA